MRAFATSAGLVVLGAALIASTAPAKGNGEDTSSAFLGETENAFQRESIEANSLSFQGAFVGGGYNGGASYITKESPADDSIIEAATCGEPVYSAEKGLVVGIGDPAVWNDGSGGYIDIAGIYGKPVRYSRLQEILYKEGDYVKKGDMVGHAGRTGDAKDLPFCVIGKSVAIAR